jgi:hypothetical protein
MMQVSRVLFLCAQQRCHLASQQHAPTSDYESEIDLHLPTSANICQQIADV